MCKRDADAIDPAEGNMVRGASASPWAVLPSPAGRDPRHA